MIEYSCSATMRAGDNMRIKLSDHFTYGRIFRFVIPTVGMMIFVSIYGIVDGFFVSNFVGKTPFAALNLIMPFIMVLGPIGYMMGTGGSAVIAKTMGEGHREKAIEYFSMMVYVTTIIGIILAIFGFIFMEPVAMLLGATEDMLGYCVLYGRICMISLPAFMLQGAFQTFMVTAEKPKLGLVITIIAGCMNMVLDFLFIAVFNWGLAGAAVATAISEFTGAIVPIVYFSRENDSLLSLGKFTMYWRVLGKTCVNGSSEMMSSISFSFVTALYNLQLMHFTGENGVAAFGVLMYVSFIYVGIFFGYATGLSPVISYHFGARNKGELQNLFGKSIKSMLACGTILMIISILLAKPLSMVFVGYDAELMELTVRGMIIYSFGFAIVGFNIFGSALFTALNNGIISAIIAGLRLLVFKSSMVLLLPVIWGIDGIWLSSVAGEVLSMAVTVLFIVRKRKNYNYF